MRGLLPRSPNISTYLCTKIINLSCVVLVHWRMRGLSIQKCTKICFCLCQPSAWQNTWNAGGIDEKHFYVRFTWTANLSSTFHSTEKKMIIDHNSHLSCRSEVIYNLYTFFLNFFQNLQRTQGVPKFSFWECTGPPFQPYLNWRIFTCSASS